MAEQQGNRVEILEAARKKDAFRREVLTGDHRPVADRQTSEHAAI